MSSQSTQHWSVRMFFLLFAREFKVKVAPPESSATKPVLVTEPSDLKKRVAVLEVEVTGPGIAEEPQVLLSSRAPVAQLPEPVPS